MKKKLRVFRISSSSHSLISTAKGKMWVCLNALVSALGRMLALQPNLNPFPSSIQDTGACLSFHWLVRLTVFRVRVAGPLSQLEGVAIPKLMQFPAIRPLRNCLRPRSVLNKLNRAKQEFFLLKYSRYRHLHSTPILLDISHSQHISNSSSHIPPLIPVMAPPRGKVAFVTGANGITGNAIIEHLIRKPESEWSVRAPNKTIHPLC